MTLYLFHVTLFGMENCLKVSGTQFVGTLYLLDCNKTITFPPHLNPMPYSPKHHDSLHYSSLPLISPQFGEIRFILGLISLGAGILCVIGHFLEQLVVLHSSAYDARGSTSIISQLKTMVIEFTVKFQWWLKTEIFEETCKAEYKFYLNQLKKKREKLSRVRAHSEKDQNHQICLSQCFYGGMAEAEPRLSELTHCLSDHELLRWCAHTL